MQNKEDQFLAWAYGCALPVAVGHTGVSASGWAVKNAESEAIVEVGILPSKRTNRGAWEAGIMAAAGALERLPPDSNVVLRMKDKTLVAATNSNFINTRGEPMAGVKHWAKLQQIRQSKRIALTAILAERNDATMRWLEPATKRAASGRLGAMSDVEALRDAVGPKVRTATPARPPTGDGQVSAPRSISRKMIKRSKMGPWAAAANATEGRCFERHSQVRYQSAHQGPGGKSAGVLRDPRLQPSDDASFGRWPR